MVLGDDKDWMLTHQQRRDNTKQIHLKEHTLKLYKWVFAYRLLINITIIYNNVLVEMGVNKT